MYNWDDKTFFFFYCFNYVGNQFVRAIRHLGCLWCIANIPRLRAVSQQHTTLHHPAGLLLKLSRVGLGWSLDGRPDAAGSGVGGPVGGTLSSGLKKIFQYPRKVIGDTALCRVPSF